MRNIYLIGMMGAGKTATGKALAKLAHFDFLDLDQEIESETHLSIKEIFRIKGEPFFRAEEKRILRRIAQQTNSIVATGGGIVLDPENVERMRETGRVFYLSASFETLWSRVRDKKDRPLLDVADPKSVFSHLFQERRPLYEVANDWRIETGDFSPDEAAKKIFEEFLK